MIIWLRILFFSIIVVSTGYSQLVPYNVQLQEELQKRGIEEEELRLLLLQRNIDINNLQDLTPSQIGELQEAIEQLQEAKKQGVNIVGPLDTIDADISMDSILSQDSLTQELLDQDSIKEYSIFGHRLVNGSNIGIIESSNGYVPPSYYRVGMGDEVAVSVFGLNAQTDELHTVLSDGSIMIREGRVKVFVKGLTLSEIREKLKKNYSRDYNFKDGQFSVSVNTIRNITVQVFGEVNNQGTFTVPAVNSIMNLLSAAGGFTDNGSVRKIKLVKRDGRDEFFDLYELLDNPKATNKYFLEDGDLIFVPSAADLVEIRGAINRPHTYELLPGEGIMSLINYAGGLNRSAYLSSMRVLRYEEDKRVVKDIPYASLIKKRQDFELNNGDIIEIDSIAALLENYVVIEGDVRKPGEFERTPGMRISDLVNLGQLKNTSKTDFAYLKRTKPDGQISIISLSIDDILKDNSPLVDLILEDRDQVMIWPKERFTDEQFIKIAGAVRYEEKIPYDQNGNLRAADAILMAGGLRRDAATFAHIHRLDPLNPADYSYVSLDLRRLMSEENSADNIVLEPFDSIYIYSKNEFYDEIGIKVSGAVNNPGEFIYGEGMSLRDAIVLAGGFKKSSATNNIEVSRVIIQDNQKTETIVKTVSLSRNGINDLGSGDSVFELEPYDNIFVRSVPEFELQQNVIVEGEVVLPGEYSIIKENETVYDLLQRAGGITESAFPAGATLYRGEDSIGFIVIRVDEILSKPNSRYNYTLKNGDELIIPKRKDYVTIAGATNIKETQNDDILGEDNSIRVPFHQGKTALFYINEYAGGFADNARKDKIWVTHPNGEVKTTEKRFPFGKKHPLVQQGSVINVGKRPVDLYGSQNKEDVNWTKVLGDSVAQAMSILTLVLLVQRLD